LAHVKVCTREDEVLARQPIAATSEEETVTITNNEAQLVVQLAQWGTTLGLEEALAALFAEDFDPVQAADDDPCVRRVLGYFEVVGTLSKRGALSGALVHDLWWVSGIWERVRPHVEGARSGSGEPRLYENFELLVQNS
jgi:hypothetical protein